VSGEALRLTCRRSVPRLRRPFRISSAYSSTTRVIGTITGWIAGSASSRARTVRVFPTPNAPLIQTIILVPRERDTTVVEP
jgi:hypothetical protein